MPNSLFIPIMLATAREERQSEKVANYVLAQAKKYGFESEIVDVKDYVTNRTIPPWQDQSEIRTWREIMKRADGLIIVTPEYNHGYPGELKLVLDQLSDEYKKKPVSICAVSSGQFGGARVVEILWNVLIELQLVPVSTSVNFPYVRELFDKNENIRDQKYDKYVSVMLNEIDWFAKTLKLGREKYGE